MTQKNRKRFRHKHLKLFCYWLWVFPGQWSGIIKFGIITILCFSCCLFFMLSSSAIEESFFHWQEQNNPWLLITMMFLPPIILGLYCYYVLPEEAQIERMCELMDSIVKKKAPFVHLLAMYWVVILAIVIIAYVLIDR